MKKLVHKLAIETPIVTITLMFALICALLQIGINHKVDKYLEVQGITQKKDETFVEVEVEKDYLEGIKKMDKVIWYEDIDSAVCDGKIIKISETQNEVIIYIDLGATNIPEYKTVYLKISYARESIIERLF